MPENNSILEKLDGLESRYEEVSTLITDPSVIADQQRYVRLTKEYKDLGDIMNARKRYINCLKTKKYNDINDIRTIDDISCEIENILNNELENIKTNNTKMTRF